MSISAKATAIAFTGPFGSGSTTAATQLAAEKKATHIRLSSILRVKWQDEHGGATPSREDLQALGNDLREQAKDPGYLAREAINALDGEEADHSYVIFDGIRNLGEIETLKDRFGRRFYLFAIDCPTSDRWERLRNHEYTGRTIADFNADDQRDKDQEYTYGQQVQLCVDAADVHIGNEDGTPLALLRQKVAGYAALVTGEAPRYPHPHEILMNLAYSSSHGSKCLKRQVGAIIVAGEPLQNGPTISLGFNENPIGTNPCVEEPKYEAEPDKGIPGRCYRDIVRQEAFTRLVEDKALCPSCGSPICGPINPVPPWRCTTCGVNLEAYFWPERAMSLCTAIHAEVAAILSAGERARGATLYSSTFPCFQCSEKLIQAGIRYVVYTEPYPDVRAAQRLELAGVKVARFEGVRSSRFDEIFSRARPHVSEQLAILAARAKL